MSAEDYNECEKLFCGSWTISKNENVEEFLAASGELKFNHFMSPTLKKLGGLFVSGCS